MIHDHDSDNDLIVISAAEEGLRLDKILAMRFSEIKSRSYFQMLFDRGNVHVNGTAVKKRHIPHEGDEVEIQFTYSPELSLSPENIPLDIVFEDESIIVINKPSGMVVHPATGNWTGTFVNALLYHCNQQSISHIDACNLSNLRPGIVHRLDKETTGLLIAAKNDDVQRRLIEQFSQRKVHKEYLAICVGNPGDCTIDEPIGRHPQQRKMMAVTPTGRQAISVCKTLSHDHALSLVNVTLITGRTHQIRVHLANRKTPVLGDPIYGSSKTNKTYHAERQMLHAHLLRLAHPVSGQMIEFKAPIPPDMQMILQHEGLHF